MLPHSPSRSPPAPRPTAEPPIRWRKRRQKFAFFKQAPHWREMECDWRLNRSRRHRTHSGLVRAPSPPAPPSPRRTWHAAVAGPPSSSSALVPARRGPSVSARRSFGLILADDEPSPTRRTYCVVRRTFDIGYEEVACGGNYSEYDVDILIRLVNNMTVNERAALLAAESCRQLTE